MKIYTIVGARPQFIKAAPVSKALRQAGHEEFLIHTGQHYDYGMSQVFFDELQLPQPDVNLGIGSSSHGKQTGQMLIGIEEILLGAKPDWVLVYGDTNSTLAGALAAAKLHIPLAHVEAGLRSFNREMPEEYNRILADQCAELLFCPTQTAVKNLRNEGITKGVHLVGDVMYDAIVQFGEFARQRSSILKDMALQSKGYVLATVHRPSNSDNAENLRNILQAFSDIDEPVIFPVHPRTRRNIEELGLIGMQSSNQKLHLVEPVGYLDMLVLEQNARVIVTDSGGVQKEAYFFAVPCLTLRTETEWVETVEAGWNVLTGTDRNRIVDNIRRMSPSKPPAQIFGDGRAAYHIVNHLPSR